MWPWKEKIQPKTVIKNVLGEVLLEIPVRDLSEIDLSNRDLRHVCLKGMTLWKVNLENSNLLGADARGTSFQKCNMKGVELSFSNCTSADFRGSDLDGCFAAKRGARILIKRSSPKLLIYPEFMCPGDERSEVDSPRRGTLVLECRGSRFPPG